MRAAPRKAIAGSALVKSAVFGNDPNWGRIVVALGYSGADTEEVAHIRGDTRMCPCIATAQPCPSTRPTLSNALQREEVNIRVDLGLGDDSATSWGCDLTPEYVRINSEYTT